MAGVSGGKPRHEGGSAFGDGASGEQAVPEVFRAAVAELLGTRLRPEITLGQTPAPRRLAPYAHALTATVEADGEELADGRLVLLHDPSGHEAWQGEFRLVSLTQADLEREIADDPLLAEVGWSWLTDALEQFGCAYTEPSGTVSRAYSQYFGGMADRPSSTEIEIRASWTPIARGDAGLNLGAHLRAWGELLCQCAGLPPSPLPLPAPGAGGAVTSGPASSVVPMPTRRQPRGGA
ncbi:DUF3000 domain-containing protein [Streptacidiphilus jiangxiensis]|uniref:DUF3000 domain-containing protein n=1 Tax=Streptacidiphilus jiangxiensis TaxID=235985 RepID=A0A1H7L092_STRJI|nr:DUF3000 domain-containing protein [Streptacidiphilus jiangxiensis]SEK92136.1 Protein of unknown function [Streptacidiphilus jiangxiensis]